MLHRAARNAYSWWWASHIRTKQSKWLDQNIQDMEEKVEYILKIIEQDGDSFAQRAEMYYRKRPELVSFVEDSFRGYRALAERYDHLSRELQTANRTIATVYPEQVQLAMDDEDDENFPTTFTPPCDPTIPPKNLPAVPKLDIPKNPKIPLKSSKAPARSISKKGLLKTSGPTIAAATTSGKNIAEALQEIDQLQKSILALQTEKEFVKSLYESRVAKYWEIEDQVTEMQARVNNLQDEFGIGTFIEDDEARTLMAATALKSCQESLIRLQEKQQCSDDEARAEYQRIKELHEKLEILKRNLGNDTNAKDLPESLKFASTSTELEDLDQERHDVELSIREKIKEQLKEDSNASLTMSELAEKIDDLVDKVITLETAVSSQNALVKRLRLETNELQAHLRSLEEDKESLIQGSDSKSNKIRELEQELLKIQNLNRNVKQQNKNLQIHFTEASFSIDHLSEKLQTVRQDEEVEHVVPFNEMRSVLPGIDHKEEFEAHEELTSLNKNSKILKDVIDVLQQSAKSNPSNRLVDLSFNGLVRAVPDAKPEFKGNEVMVAPGGHDSTISKDATTGEKAKKDGIAVHSTWVRIEDDNSVMSSPSNLVGNPLLPVEGRDVPDQSSHIKAEENYDKKMEEKGSENDYPDHNPVKAEEDFSFQLNPLECLEDLSVNGQVGAVFGTNHFNDYPRKSQARAAQDVVTERIIKEGVTGPGNDSMISKDMIMEQKKSDNSRDYNFVGAEENFIQSYPSFQFDSIPGEVEARAGPHAKPAAKGHKEQEDMVAPGMDSPISKDEKTRKEATKDDVLDHSTFVKANEEENYIESNPSKLESKELETEDEEGEPDWRQLFMNGLDDREKVLLQQYTSILRNYKQTKKQLSEIEKKNHDSLFKSASQIKELKNANALKDAEIRSLHKKMNLLLQVCPDQTPDTQRGGPGESTTSPIFTNPSPDSDQKKVADLLDGHKIEPLETAPELPAVSSPGKGEEGEKRVISFDEPHAISTVEEKIRSDIDGLLEENIEFWLRFSTSFHQIEKFQTSVRDLQEELAKTTESRKQDGNSKHHSSNSDVRPIYTHLREIQTELAMWLEHNSLLEDDLQNRLSSLSSIQEEILRLSNAGSKEEEESELSDYEAAKYQGEVLNMKQENNKVAYKLHAGLERVKEFRAEIAKTLENLEEELGISASKNQAKNRTRIPLRSFLFGVRLRKQKASLFQCMSPSLQKQYSDLNTLPT